MKRVYKETLAVEDWQEILIPKGSELLHVAEQHGSLCLWFRCDPEREKVERSILIRGTGHRVNDEPYVGTVLVLGGDLVWHVFDGGEVH